MTSVPAFRQLRFAPPAGACRLLLVRHGESEAAVDGRPFELVGGHGDPALASEGRQQSELVASRLAGYRPAALYVTSLRRTAETAAPLAALLDLVPVVEADLREVFLGEWEGGLFRRKVHEDGPEARRMRERQRWDEIPGAESNEAFAARVGAAVARIAAAHRDERVAVFSHGGTIGQVLALATGCEPFALNGVDNASISEVVVTDDRWVVRRFNDTAHLEYPTAPADGAGPVGPAPGSPTPAGR